MGISDQAHICKLSCDFAHNAHGPGCEFRGTSLGQRTRRRAGGARRGLRWDGSGMVTPAVEWKLNGFASGPAPVAAGGKGRIRRARGGGLLVGRSARKLAAGMWRLTAPVGNCGGGGVTWHWRHGRFHQFPLGMTVLLKEGATKWDFHDCPVEVCQFHSQVKLLKNQQVATISVARALKVELVRNRNRVKELETERHLFKRKIKHFLRELNHEKACWMRGERKKMFLIIDELKSEIERERRKCQTMETLNSKLLSDLADAKLSNKHILKDCEKERNARQLLEDVCRELGKDIAEHKANIRAMKMECARIQEEVEEERQMMQMAEVWREERVQMKLVDVKLILEERYFQMNNLIAELENLLRSNNATPDAFKITEARGLDMDFPPHANGIYTIVENPQDNETIETGLIDECQIGLFASQSSEFQHVNPEANESTKNLLHGHSEDNRAGNAIHMETKTRMVGDCSCSADTTNGGGYFPSASIGKDGNTNQNPRTNNISSSQKLKNKGPYIGKIWKSSPGVSDILKTIPIHENVRLSNGSNSSILAVTPENVSEQDYNLNEPGQRNPHISRAMRGCIEWPRGIQKYGVKGKLLEASLESEKTQLRNVLQQRMK